MKKYKLSLDESIPNSLQVNTLITVEADTLIGLLSKFLLAITAYEEQTIEDKISEAVLAADRFNDRRDDDIPF